MKQAEKPDFVSDEHLVYLDKLRASGATNMFGAGPFLLRKFPNLSKQQAHGVLGYWMDTFPRKDAE